jgi:hypothetical protein
MAKRADAIHQMLLTAYPKPIGCETAWNKIFATGEYGFAAVPWVYTFNYVTAVYEYVCVNNKPVKNSETGTSFNVISNRFNWFWNSTSITINGQEVFSLKPRLGKWNGYDTYGSESEILLILNRKDMLPYKPVTRKQYINYMIHWIDSFYSVMINGMKQMPEPPPKDEITNLNNTKNRFIKIHQNALDKSGTMNLLDSPAVITPITVHNFDDNTDIFTTEEKGGTVLVMANPAYFRKDFPKYIPQFMVLRLSSPQFPSQPIIYFTKKIKEKFPLKNLQAMIDK